MSDPIVLYVTPDRADIKLPCACLPARSLGMRIGREVDRDCPVHGAELRDHEAETGLSYGKPRGRDIGPFGVVIAGSPEEVQAVIDQYWPGWMRDADGSWRRKAK